MTVHANKFVTTNIKSVVERANDILVALKELGMKVEETYEFAKKRSEDRPDRFERASWVLAVLELHDAIVMDGDGVKAPITNGGF
jgi:hypothetical protein